MTGSKETVAATDTAIRRLAYRGRGIPTARATAAVGIHPEVLFRAGKRGTDRPTGYRGVYSVFPPELLSARDRLAGGRQAKTEPAAQLDVEPRRRPCSGDGVNDGP